MFKKWNLDRYPFYTRPVDRDMVEDYVHRSDIQDPINKRRLVEGLHLLIGERGVGTTSYGNYLRFSDPRILSPSFEIRIEGMEDSKEVMESVIYCLAKEILANKIRSKKAKDLIQNFEGNIKNNSFQLQAAGFGVGWSKVAGSGFESNMMSLTSIFEDLVKDVVKSKNFDSVIIQLNNLEVPHIFKEHDLKKILEPLRDIFQVKNVSWFLLGDSGFENLLMKGMSRFASIVKTNCQLPPISNETFNEIILKRVDNSGDKAICPFDEASLVVISRASLGRTRFSLELASKITERYADQPIPKIISEKEVEYEVKSRIEAIAASKNFPSHCLEILTVISENPEINSSKLAQMAGVYAGNLKKYTSLLEKEKLIAVEKKGRSTIYKPSGFGAIIGLFKG